MTEEEGAQTRHFRVGALHWNSCVITNKTQRGWFVRLDVAIPSPAFPPPPPSPPFRAHHPESSSTTLLPPVSTFSTFARFITNVTHWI